MRRILWIFFFIYCQAKDKLGESYSKIKIYEYIDYTDMTFLKFHIDYPSLIANWTVNLHIDEKCSKDLKYFHFDLQHQAYPLVSPRNESFPDMYITSRHDLITTVFNRTETNLTVQIDKPLRGTWFAMTYMERIPFNLNSKITPTSCNMSLATWLYYQVVSDLFILTINQPLQIILSNHNTSIYISYYTSIGNIPLAIQSEWSTNCQIDILIRLNGLPSFSQYDYEFVCRNSFCLFELDPLADFIWIYFQISIRNLSCLNPSINGTLIVFSTDKSINYLYSTQRIKSNSYYEFEYISDDANRSLNKIFFSNENSSIYSYEFIVDDELLGGTLYFDFQTNHSNKSMNQSIHGCLSKNTLFHYQTCETNYQIILNQNSSSQIKSLPYPEMGHWYLTLEYSCNSSIIDCQKSSMFLKLKIFSTKCTHDQCGTYGNCQIMISQQNIFSTCSCTAAFRGYGCTDDRYNRLDKYLPGVLFLTLSNLLFLPAIILAIYFRLYIEALVYFFNMFFSTFYHACDQEIHQICIYEYDGLQLVDFIASYSSFVITLITMSLISRSKKIFLIVLGILICVTVNSRDRFDSKQVIILIAIVFTFTILSWIIISIRTHRLQPARKQLLFIIPGLIISIIGIVLFSFVETNDNYWYTHSLWHICMAVSILFYLPRRIQETQTNESTIGINNHGLILTDDDGTRVEL